MTVAVRGGAFDPWEELRGYQQSHPERKGAFGATAVFVGTLRDMNEGDEVRAMTLEHYPGMTERELEGICREASRHWELIDTLVVHRVGELRPGDPIVLVAVWSAHRKEGFEACRRIMEDLKSRAPFWKKEHMEAGSRWVGKNTPGY